MTHREPTSPSDLAFLALVALLPLHTVYLQAVVSWKPWLVLLAVVAGLDLWSTRRFPWHPRVSIGIGLFLIAVLVSWPGPGAPSGFWRLFLALAAGGLLLAVTARRATDLDRVLRVVFWSAAAMGVTALLLGLITNGVFGEAAVTGVNEIPGVDRVNKPAYLGSGFIALTNWHQDPGYAALWTNVWLVLAGFAWTRGTIRGPSWLGPVVIGGLITATVLTYSRTGWLGLTVALAVLAITHARQGETRQIIRLLGGGLIVAVGMLVTLVVTDPGGVGGDMGEALGFRFTYLVALGPIDLGEEGVVDPGLIVDDNRLDVWREYWGRFTEQPVRGIGLGTGWDEEGLQEPHNMWLQLLAETGLIGLLGFLVLLVVIGRGGGPVAGSVLVVIGLASLTQTVIFEPALWFGLGLWRARVAHHESEEETAAVA